MNKDNKNIDFLQSPEIEIDTKKVFGVNCSFAVKAFKNKNEYVPEIDNNYKFDPETTKSILLPK